MLNELLFLYENKISFFLLRETKRWHYKRDKNSYQIDSLEIYLLKMDNVSLRDLSNMIFVLYFEKTQRK